MNQLQAQLEEGHPLSNQLVYNALYTFNVEVSWYLLSQLGVAVNNQEVFGESLPVFDGSLALAPDDRFERSSPSDVKLIIFPSALQIQLTLRDFSIFHPRNSG